MSCLPSIDVVITTGMCSVGGRKGRVERARVRLRVTMSLKCRHWWTIPKDQIVVRSLLCLLLALRSRWRRHSERMLLRLTRAWAQAIITENTRLETTAVAEVLMTAARRATPEPIQKQTAGIRNQIRLWLLLRGCITRHTSMIETVHLRGHMRRLMALRSGRMRRCSVSSARAEIARASRHCYCKVSHVLTHLNSCRRVGRRDERRERAVYTTAIPMLERKLCTCT